MIFSGCIFVADETEQVVAPDQHVRMFFKVEMVFALWNIGSCRRRSQSFNIYFTRVGRSFVASWTTGSALHIKCPSYLVLSTEDIVLR